MIFTKLGIKFDTTKLELKCNGFYIRRCIEFEPVSATHELNPLCLKLSFQPTPIIAGLV